MKATIKIELRKDYATKEGKQMVCLRYTAYRRSTLISMNIAVLPKHWNKVSNTVRSSEPRCYYYNKAISEVYQKADSIVMENFFTPLPIPQFLERLKDKHHGNTDFYVFIENEIEQLKQSRAAGTISNYYKLINTMKEWKPTLSFGEITLDFIQQFHNHELEVLQDNLDTMIDLLNPGGRICIITFHSLEDRIVKTNFKRNENPCTCPSDFPVCVCGKKSKGRVITRKPVLPGERELAENSRSKSAKLRVFERA